MRRSTSTGTHSLRTQVPLRPPVDRRRAFTKFACMRVFLEVGFIDRYSGDRLFGEGP